MRKSGPRIQGHCTVHLVTALATLWILAPANSADRVVQDRPGIIEEAAIHLPPLTIHRHAGFTRLNSIETGIRFTNGVSLEAVAKNRLIEDGSGVAAGDVNGDGLCDLYFGNLEGKNALFLNTGGFRFIESTEPAGIACPGQATTGVALADLDGDSDLDLLVNGWGVGPRLFLNDGKGHFSEKNDAGLQRNSGARSIALADIDADGDLDLYVTNYRPTTSRDEPQTIRISRRGKTYEVPPAFRERFAADANEIGGVVLNEFGEPDRLYRNLGSGRFEEIPWTDGNFLDHQGRALTAPPRDWGLSAMFRDLNQDGAPDLYVCNDFHSPDRLWLNDGAGRFLEAPATALRKNSWAAMAVDFADINGDGLDDFFVAEMLGSTRVRRHTQRDNVESPGILHRGWGWTPGEVTQVTSAMRNTLFLNLGGGHFAEAAYYAGVQASDWTWGAAFLDVDLDGYPDLLIANGHVRDHLNSDIQSRLAQAGAPRNAADRKVLFGQIPRLSLPNRIFRNRGDVTFEDRSTDWGFDESGVSVGMALADLDNDGDLDVVLNNMDANASILRNDSTRPRLAIRTRGRAPNTGGIGARIRVFASGLPQQSQEIIGGGRYLSSDDGVRSFAASHSTNRVTVEIVWRNGQRNTFSNQVPNQILTLIEAADNSPSQRAKPTKVVDGSNSWYASFPRSTDWIQQASNSISKPVITSRKPLFEDVSGRLDLVSTHRPDNELTRQPLLPRKLSHAGPGVSCSDINGDGHDDIIFPASHPDPAQLRINDGTGNFVRAAIPATSQELSSEQTTFLSWMTGPGTGMMVAGVSRSETSQKSPVNLAVYTLSGSEIRAVSGPELSGNTGPIAAADVDSDGDLDIFVGGQPEPGRYPLAARSTLLRQNEGRFLRDDRDRALFETVGLVNGAVWTDLHNDGWPDLILAGEWGPIRVFENQKGQLTEWDPPLHFDGVAAKAASITKLSALSGWWTGVAAGDFNGDGRLDIVAGNWGRNSKYQEFIDGGLRLYHGELADGSTGDLLETYWDPGLGKEVPWRDFFTLSRAFPMVAQKIRSYAAFATNSIQELFGTTLTRATRLEAVTLDSVVFLNLGDRWEAHPLPLLAQFAPGFSPAVADFDGDGAEDLFLSQNSFAMDKESGRLDSGRGLLLRGDGRGNFSEVPADVSGIALAGEQRGAAVGDFDEDGRVDLLVAQHAAPAKLFYNREARPGLRVRLIGPTGNRQGIGAHVRLGDGTHFGPVREIHAGSGYRSQDSPVVVLAVPSGATQLRVRWPGGRVTETKVPSGSREAVVDFSENKP
jgi:hypothetical protein